MPLTAVRSISRPSSARAPYGDVTGFACLLVLLVLTVGLFLLIRPLLNRKLS